MMHEYADILRLPRPVSKHRARMSMQDRAAQFSPFAALTGFDAAVAETGRLTGSRIELAVDGREALNEALARLQRTIGEGPRAVITHFVPDERKAGGSYVVTEGAVRRISSQEGCLVLEGGTQIFFEDILSLETH